MNKERKLKIINLIMKIIYFTLLLTITGYIIYSLIDAHIKDLGNITSSILNYPAAYLVVALIFGAIAYGFLLILGLVNILITTFNKTYPRNIKYIVISFITTLLPIIFYFLIILIAKP